MEVKTKTVFRSGNLIGIPVMTPDLKRIGEIEEVVIDVPTGRVIYAVLGFGGLFGLGDKFFAVPWEEFSLVHGETEAYFVVDTSREKLKQLQGFSKLDWPDIADSNWDELVDVDQSQNPDERDLSL